MDWKAGFFNQRGHMTTQMGSNFQRHTPVQSLPKVKAIIAAVLGQLQINGSGFGLGLSSKLIYCRCDGQVSKNLWSESRRLKHLRKQRSKNPSTLPSQNKWSAGKSSNEHLHKAMALCLFPQYSRFPFKRDPVISPIQVKVTLRAYFSSVLPPFLHYCKYFELPGMREQVTSLLWWIAQA